MSLSTQKHTQTTIPKARPLLRQFIESPTHWHIILPAASITQTASAQRAPRLSSQATGPPLRKLVFLSQMHSRFSLCGRPYHFFDSTSFKAALSNIVRPEGTRPTIV